MQEPLIRRVTVVLGGDNEPITKALAALKLFSPQELSIQELLEATYAALEDSGPLYPNEWQGALFESLCNSSLEDNTITLAQYQKSCNIWQSLCKALNESIWSIMAKHRRQGERLTRAKSSAKADCSVVFEYSQ